MSEEQKTYKKNPRNFIRNGGIWLKEKVDGAGNRTQFMTISIRVMNKSMLFTAWPNMDKTNERQPDFLVFSSQPINPTPKGGGAGGKSR